MGVKLKTKIFTLEQKQEVKNNLRTILLYYGAIPGKYNWSCLPTRHNNPKNDLSIRNNICCCHCGLKGDSFNVIAEIEGLDLKNDFSKIVEKGLEIIGSNIEYKKDTRVSRDYKKYNSRDRLINIYSLTPIITKHFKVAKQNDYKFFYNRKISKEVIKKYRILVNNPRLIFPTNIVPRLNNIFAYRYIIPVWEDQKVVNCLLRRDDNLSQENDKILNLKHLQLKIFNLSYVRNIKANDNLFLTEGIFDALSFESIGFKGIALNSTSMANQFLKVIEEKKDQLKENNVTFFLAFDNDKAGKECTNKIKETFKEMNIKYFILLFNKYKDINEYFIKDTVNFKIKIKNILKGIR